MTQKFVLSSGVNACFAVHLFSYFNENGQMYSWEETVELPIKYRDLPLSTLLVLVIWNIKSPKRIAAVAANVISLFDVSSGIMCRGLQKLHLHPLHTNQGKPVILCYPVDKDEKDNMLAKLLHNFPPEKLCKSEQLPFIPTHLLTHGEDITKNEASRIFFEDSVVLFIEFLVLNHQIVFHQESYPTPNAKEISGFPPKKKKQGFVYDPELSRDNPVEFKHVSLMVRRTRDEYDKDLKPNIEELQKLKAIIRSPITRHLEEEEKNMLWKFRYWLKNNKKALIKFLQCVNWKKSREEILGLDLMNKWETIDIADALGLLSHEFANLPIVRNYAVKCLSRAKDEELQYYLLQLVQSLRYDKGGESPLLNFLILRATHNFTIASKLYWFLNVEATNHSLANDSIYYRDLFQEYIHALKKAKSGPEFIRLFERQKDLVRKLASIALKVKKGTGDKPAKEEMAAKLIEESLSSFEPLPLPLNPSLIVKGILAKVKIFTSALAPMKIDFDILSGGTFGLIFKIGDDLRQDQLIIQLIALMDRLLKKENLDLKLIPYKVLATSCKDGMLECVPNALNVSIILTQYNGDIKKFLKEHNPDPVGPYGINPIVHDTFIRSVAGYCVITYILGIGDRHLDNLLLTTSGNFFHIDFGFILGRDPKGFATPMRITREMIEGMGGEESNHYELFKQYCCEAFNILRKSADLILNLLSLMLDAGIEHIKGTDDLLVVRKRLKLKLTDEQASQLLTELIKESVNALMPKVMEFFHRTAVLYH